MREINIRGITKDNFSINTVKFEVKFEISENWEEN